MYGYLPTQRRLHRYNVHISNLCPTCRTHIKTDQHFLICGGTDPWEDILFQPIESLCKQYGTMILHNHFCNNTRSFLRGIPTNPALLQTDIGWETIFYGLLSSEWIELHQHTASHHGGTLEFATNLISVILQAVASRWRTDSPS